MYKSPVHIALRRLPIGTFRSRQTQQRFESVVPERHGGSAEKLFERE